MKNNAIAYIGPDGDVHNENHCRLCRAFAQGWRKGLSESTKKDQTARAASS
jgi:hypothetical protein